jgi:hypothetical protein
VSREAISKITDQFIDDLVTWRSRQDLTGKINGWKTILNTLTVHYSDQVTASSVN